MKKFLKIFQIILNIIRRDSCVGFTERQIASLIIAFHMKCHMSNVSQNSILLHFYKYDFLKLKVKKKIQCKYKIYSSWQNISFH